MFDAPSTRSRPSFRPRLEQLESRTLLSDVDLGRVRTTAVMPPVATQASERDAPAPVTRDAAATQRFTPRPFSMSRGAREIVNPQLPTGPVAVTHWHGDWYLVCNYTQLFAVNLRRGTSLEFAPPAGPRQWSPTAVAVDPRNRNLLLVANTTGRELLMVRIRATRLQYVRRYSSSIMRGPEGVAVTPSGSHIIASDPYANRLFYFRRDGRLLWVRPVNGAHGLTATKDAIYVTSLYQSQLYRYDLRGRLQATVGRLGWGANEYLWPTSISTAPGGFVVSDSRTGKVAFLTPDLQMRGWFGGNGPGLTLFNMPYAATATGARLVVADTMKSRLIVFRGRHAVSILARTPRPAAAGTRAPITRTGYINGYLESSTVYRLRVAGLGRLAWRPGLGAFSQPRGKLWTKYYFPRKDSLFSSTYPYFTWAVPAASGGQNLTLVGHEQGPNPLVVDAAGRATVISAPLAWERRGRLVDEYGFPVDLQAELGAAAARFQRHDELLLKGNAPLAAMSLAYAPDMDAPSYVALVRKTFRTLPGKRFLQATLGNPSPAALAVARARYFAAVARQSTVELQEVFLVNLIARAAALL